MALFNHGNEKKGEIVCVGCGLEIKPLNVSKGIDNTLSIVLPVHVCPPYEPEERNEGLVKLDTYQRGRLSSRRKLP